MIRYARILKLKEKDNPSPFCRGSYLVSNVGDLVKCRGRMLRFPDLEGAYMAEMRLALGDVLMQTDLIEEESKLDLYTPEGDQLWSDIDSCFVVMSGVAATLFDLWQLEVGPKYKQSGVLGIWDIPMCVKELKDVAANICQCLEWRYADVEHLGFIHTIERFEEFEARGWQ